MNFLEKSSHHWNYSVIKLAGPGGFCKVLNCPSSFSVGGFCTAVVAVLPLTSLLSDIMGHLVCSLQTSQELYYAVVLKNLEETSCKKNIHHITCPSCLCKKMLSHKSNISFSFQ